MLESPSVRKVEDYTTVSSSAETLGPVELLPGSTPSSSQLACNRSVHKTDFGHGSNKPSSPAVGAMTDADIGNMNIQRLRNGNAGDYKG